MTWFIWLYIIPAFFILTLAIPTKYMISENIVTALFIVALCPITNLLFMIGVIYNLCTVKDFTPYANDEEIKQKLEELGKQFNELFNKLFNKDK